MDITLLVLLIFVAVGITAAYCKGGFGQVLDGLTNSVRLIRGVWLRLVLGFTLAGFVGVLLPSELIVQWLGPASGLKGIFVATLVGIIIGGGGPYVGMPITASVLAVGAGIGPVIALLTAWNLVNIRGLLIWQIPFLGMRLAVARYLACLLVPPSAGILGGYIYQWLT
ncbi:hypothetical protein ACFLYV_02765 [Chloroflexota bacterium]